MACRMKFDPRTGTYRKRCSRRRKKRGLFGEIGDIGAIDRGRAKGFLTLAGLSIPALIYAGALGALGALGASYIWKKIDPKVGTSEGIAKDATVRALAEMGTGAVIALICIKLLKQPRLGAALAIGPIVVGMRDLLKPMLPASWGFTGLSGIPSVSRPGPKPYPAALPQMAGIPQVGARIPTWTQYPRQFGYVG